MMVWPFVINGGTFSAQDAVEISSDEDEINLDRPSTSKTSQTVSAPGITNSKSPRKRLYIHQDPDQDSSTRHESAADVAKKVIQREEAKKQKLNGSNGHTRSPDIIGINEPLRSNTPPLHIPERLPTVSPPAPRAERKSALFRQTSSEDPQALVIVEPSPNNHPLPSTVRKPSPVLGFRPEQTGVWADDAIIIEETPPPQEPVSYPWQELHEQRIDINAPRQEEDSQDEIDQDYLHDPPPPYVPRSRHYTVSPPPRRRASSLPRTTPVGAVTSFSSSGRPFNAFPPPFEPQPSPRRNRSGYRPARALSQPPRPHSDNIPGLTLLGTSKGNKPTSPHTLPQPQPQRRVVVEPISHQKATLPPRPPRSP